MLRKAVSILMAVFSLSSSIAYGDTIKTINGESVVDISAPYIEAKSAIIVDIRTGQQLYGKNIYEKKFPASITKIMTCMLAIENLKLDDVITFSKEAVNIEMGSSAAYVVEGEQISVEDCLYGLMVHSCNDLANGLAEAVSGDLASFATLMTKTAKELGCKNTNFVNAHGLDDENHYTCAYDMALIGKKAYESQALYRDIIKQQRYQVEPTNKCEETRYWKNGNELILEGGWYYYEDCLGGKTGYTEKAGYTLVSYANINGRELICVLLDAPNKGQAAEETKLLYEFIRENVSVDYYVQIDKIYKEEKEQEESIDAANKVEQEKQNAQKNEENNTDNDKAKSKIPIWVKILVTIIIILVGFYGYLRYKIYIRRKRRREMRRRRRMEQKRKMEERYRQTRFYQDNSNGENKEDSWQG